MFLLQHLLSVLLIALISVACNDNGASTDTDTAIQDGTADTFVRPPETVRFAIEVTNDVPESIWVQVNDLEGQVAWVTVKDGSGAPIWFHDRCSIEECENPTGVCGVAEILVRNITGGTYTGKIELFWDGMTSVVEGSPECERREAAPAGTYKASFCWSLTADTQGTGEPTEGLQGTLTNPICQEVDFELPAAKNTDVLFKIQGG